MDARTLDVPSGGDSPPPVMAPAMALALQANFGSVAGWHAQFAAAAARSPQAALVFHSADGTLAIEDAAAGSGIHLLVRAPADAAPSDLEAFMQAIDWPEVYARYQAAVDAASEPFAATADDLPGACVLDVRRAAVFGQAAAVIPGARWRDPAHVADWCRELPANQPVIVYCVYGHEVGRATALRLRAAGVPARFLRGGIDGWTAAGRPLAAKAAAGSTP